MAHDPKQNGQRATLTMREFCKYLGINEKAGYAGAKSGAFPCFIRVGKRYLAPRVAVERWLASAGIAKEAA